MSCKEAALENIALKRIHEEAQKRYNSGRDVYGIFDPHTDTRDLIKETVDELLDVINYVSMLIIQLRALK